MGAGKLVVVGCGVIDVLGVRVGDGVAVDVLVTAKSSVGVMDGVPVGTRVLVGDVVDVRTDSAVLLGVGVPVEIIVLAGVLVITGSTWTGDVSIAIGVAIGML